MSHDPARLALAAARLAVDAIDTDDLEPFQHAIWDLIATYPERERGVLVLHAFLMVAAHAATHAKETGTLTEYTQACDAAIAAYATGNI